MAPKPSKTTTAWWLASNSKTTPVFMKSQIKNQQSEKPELPQHKPGSPWENWSLPTTSQLHLFCTTWSLLRTILHPASWWLSQSCDFYAAAFCCRDVCPNGPNNKHGLEEHLWHVGSTTSAVASLRVARLGWLPSQDQLKPDLPQHKPGSPWENWSLPTTSQLHLFCTTWSLLRIILHPASWWLSQSCDSYAAALCCRDVGPNRPNAWKNTCGTLAVRLQQWHPCEWKD